MKGLTKGNSVFVFILELFYFYSDSIDIFIKRDGDYWSKKISIENYKLVSDLLEESRSILKFKKHDQLTAHKTPHGERIDDSLPTSAPEPFWTFRCSKMARRCGAKHICKSKCGKHHTLGPLFEVHMSKNGTPLWREAHLQGKIYKTPAFCSISRGF